jgi:hypothetical protein
MKIKKGFMLRKVAGENVVVAIAEASKSLNGMIKLNDTGAFVWNLIKDGATKEDIVEKICNEYEISNEQAKSDLDAFLEVLNSANCLEQ